VPYELQFYRRLNGISRQYDTIVHTDSIVLIWDTIKGTFIDEIKGLAFLNLYISEKAQN